MYRLTHIYMHMHVHIHINTLQTQSHTLTHKSHSHIHSLMHIVTHSFNHAHTHNLISKPNCYRIWRDSYCDPMFPNLEGISHSVVLRTYSLLGAQKSILVVLRELSYECTPVIHANLWTHRHLWSLQTCDPAYLWDSTQLRSHIYTHLYSPEHLYSPKHLWWLHTDDPIHQWFHSHLLPSIPSILYISEISHTPVIPSRPETPFLLTPENTSLGPNIKTAAATKPEVSESKENDPWESYGSIPGLSTTGEGLSKGGSSHLIKLRHGQ